MRTACAWILVGGTALLLAAWSHASGADCLIVSVPDSVEAGPGALVDVPILVTPTFDGGSVIGFLATMTFDPTRLAFVEVRDCVGGVSYPGGWKPLTSNLIGNELRVAGASSEALAAGGCLFVVRFRVLADVPLGVCSTIDLSRVLFNAGTPCATLVDGKVCVSCRAPGP